MHQNNPSTTKRSRPPIRSDATLLKHEIGRSKPAKRIPFGVLFMCILLAGVLFEVRTTSAQTWQYVYGEDNTHQEGRRGVIPVTGACAGSDNGYISVGYSKVVNSTDVDIYVMRTDNSGATTVWERTYDINGGVDYGESIVELSNGSGFVITGYTTSGNGTDIFLMKIDCNGNIIGVRTYGTPTEDEYAYDLIQTSNGQFVLAGKVVDVNNNVKALLIRTQSNGNTVWSSYYDLGSGTDEVFWSLTEATPFGGQTFGDIVAAGSTTPTISPPFSQGYVARVNGTNGAIVTGVGSLQGAATYGGLGLEEFFSVIELQNPNELGSQGAPNVVLAGSSGSRDLSVPGNIDIYLVKLDNGNPCTVFAQATHGHLGPFMEDVARCIREVPFAPASGANFQQWDLALTGYTNNSPFMHREMILYTVNPGTLSPSFPSGISWVFGITGEWEDGWSLYPVEATGGRTEGFVLCGYTTSYWHTPNVLDTRDVYMVKTNNQGNAGTYCEYGYGPSFEDEDWLPDCVTPIQGGTYTATPVFHSFVNTDYDDIVCTNSNNDGKRVVLRQDLGSAEIETAPNPVEGGRELILEVNSVDVDFGFEVTVLNQIGEAIPEQVRQITPSEGHIVLSTENWPSGTYHIEVVNGDTRWHTRVIVVE